MRAESFLPKKAFAGSNKNPLGTKGQARGEPKRSQKAPLTGLMVGEVANDGDFILYVDGKPFTHYKNAHTAQSDIAIIKNKFPNRKVVLKPYVATNNIKEGVIIGHDKDDPEVAVLGGAGSYKLSTLKRKAVTEADWLLADLKNGDFEKAANNVKQLGNTLKTISLATAEMRNMYFGESVESKIAKLIKILESK